MTSGNTDLDHPSRETRASGQARITSVIAADPDFGTTELRVDGAREQLIPFEPTASRLVPTGVRTLAIGAPETGETFASASPELREGTAYTVVWIGGGETAGKLSVIEDAAQALNPPGPSQRIDTGLPAISMWLTWLMLALAGCTAAAVLRRGVGRGALGAILMVVLVGCASGTASAPQATVPAAPRSPAPATSVPGPMPAAGPTRLRADAIGLDEPLSSMPTTDIPGLPGNLPLDQIAWLDGSSLPGVRGTAAVIGHTTHDGRGAFAELVDLRPGDTVEVIDTSGTLVRYTVRQNATYPKDAFPGDVWAPQPFPSLALITCTAHRNPGTGIADNRVVWATAEVRAASGRR